MIDAVRRCTDLPIDVHLMVIHPRVYFDDFAGQARRVSPFTQKRRITFNATSRTSARSDAAPASLINPATPLDTVREVVADIDLLLVMSVNPGFGGQAFIPASSDKIRPCAAHAR